MFINFLCSSLARLIFPATDDPLLNTLYDDNQRIEPEWYCPIIPMVLINGTEGIGTGWSTKMANYDVREVVANVKRMLDGEEPLPMVNKIQFSSICYKHHVKKFFAKDSFTVYSDLFLTIHLCDPGSNTSEGYYVDWVFKSLPDCVRPVKSLYILPFNAFLGLRFFPVPCFSILKSQHLERSLGTHGFPPRDVCCVCVFFLRQVKNMAVDDEDSSCLWNYT